MRKGFKNNLYILAKFQVPSIKYLVPSFAESHKMPLHRALYNNQGAGVNKQ